MKEFRLAVSALLVYIVISVSGCATSSGTVPSLPDIKGPYYEAANGGNGITLAVLAPEGKNIRRQDLYLPDLIQGSLIESFEKLSAMTLVSRRELDQLRDGPVFPEGSANSLYILSGDLMALSDREYSLSLSVVDSGTGKTMASYQKTALGAQGIKHGALRDAAMELLGALGVKLTPAGIALLQTQAAGAQEKLAKSREAARSGRGVEALANAYSAQCLNPSLPEAEEQLRAASAAVSSGIPGNQNDLQRQRAWREQLADFERYYRDYHPFEIWYTPVPEQRGDTNYAAGTADFEFTIGLLPSRDFSAMQNVLNFLSNELNRTGNRRKWGFSGWPQEEVEYDLYKLYKISVVAGLFDRDGNEISRASATLYSQLYYRNNSVLCDSTQKALVLMPGVDVKKLNLDMKIRILSIDSGIKLMNADEAENDGYWSINPVTARQFPAGTPSAIPEKERLIPIPEPNSSESQTQPPANRPRTPRQPKALDTRFGLSFGGLIETKTFADYSPGEYLKKSWIAASLELGFRVFTVEGIVHWPIDSEIYNKPDSTQIDVFSLGVGLGYSFVARYLLSTISAGFTYTQLPENEKVNVPYAQIKFDVMPWETGLGLRLGFMAEAASMGWGEPYSRYFAGSIISSGGWRVNGKAMAGLVLWF